MFPSTCWLDNESQLKNSQIINQDVGTLKLPSNDLHCSWSLVQQLSCQLWKLGGNTGPSWAGTCAPEWRGFFHKERPRHFQRQHCACETPTVLQKESAISFTFSLSVCTSQSNTLSFRDKNTCFYFPHMKKTKKTHIKPRAFFFFFFTFLQSQHTNLPCRNCQQLQQISHRPSVAIHSRI